MASAPSLNQDQVLRHRALLENLQPEGLLWTRKDGQRREVLEALATELARVELRVEDLYDEADPTTAAELLKDWERVTGLPDPCLTATPTTAQRRANVKAKLAQVGDQSLQFFFDLAAVYGFLGLELIEYQPFVTGPWGPDNASKVGDSLTNGDWLHTLAIQSELVGGVVEFKVGANTVGDPLRSWGNTTLPCVIDRAKPAHVVSRYLYSGILLESDWTEWVRVFGTFPVPVAKWDGTPPPQSHVATATLLACTDPVRGAYALTTIDFPADGVSQSVHLFCRKPEGEELPGSVPADDFGVELYDGITPVALSHYEFQWSGADLVVSASPPGGELAEVEDMGGGWWRAKITWVGTAGLAGKPQTVNFWIAETAPAQGDSLIVAGAKIT